MFCLVQFTIINLMACFLRVNIALMFLDLVDNLPTYMKWNHYCEINNWRQACLGNGKCYIPKVDMRNDNALKIYEKAWAPMRCM